MSIIRCALLPAILLVIYYTGSVSGLQSCPVGWSLKYDKCYKLFTDRKNWMEAQESCEFECGDLVKVANQNIQSFIAHDIIKDDNTDVWMGLNDRISEGQWYWMDGSQPAYKNWNCFQPDNFYTQNCAYFWKGKNFKWDDGDCEKEMEYVCQKNPTIYCH